MIKILPLIYEYIYTIYPQNTGWTVKKIPTTPSLLVLQIPLIYCDITLKS